MIDVVLPALNEAIALPAVLAALPDGYRAIVVDNGSSDGTAEVARGAGAMVVFEARAGYGAAVHAGIVAASSGVVCVMDADGSLDPTELPPLVDLVVTGSADLVIGRRRATQPGVWPWHSQVANRLVARRLSRRLGVVVHDIGPVRVFRRQAVLDLGIEDRRFGYPLETLVRAARSDWRIAERDVSYGPRAVGSHSKVTGSVSGTVKAVRDFTRVMP